MGCVDGTHFYSTNPFHFMKGQIMKDIFYDENFYFILIFLLGTAFFVVFGGYYQRRYVKTNANIIQIKIQNVAGGYLIWKNYYSCIYEYYVTGNKYVQIEKGRTFFLKPKSENEDYIYYNPSNAKVIRSRRWIIEQRLYAAIFFGLACLVLLIDFLRR